MQEIDNYEFLLRLSRGLNEKLDLDQSIRIFFELVEKGLGISEMGILKYDKAQGKFALYRGHNIDEKRYLKIVDGIYKSMISPKTMGEKANLEFMDNGEKKSLAFINLSVERKNIGILAIIRSPEKKGPAHQLELLRAVGAQLATLLERDRLFKEVCLGKDTLSLVNEINCIIAEAGLDEKKMLEALTLPFYHHFNASALGLALHNPDSSPRIIVKSQGRMNCKRRERLISALKASDCLPYDAQQEKYCEYGTGEYLSTSDLPSIISSFDEEVATDLVTIALPSQNHLDKVATMGMCANEGQNIDIMNPLFPLLVNPLALVVENIQLLRKHERLAYTDALTGAFNHRYFQEILEKEFVRASRYGGPLSLIMLDIDHFKRFNDLYGHLQGDKVLAEVAELLRQSVRDVDIVARYGGEEFVIILPQTDFQSAYDTADRIRHSVEAKKLRAINSDTFLSVTISLGLAQYEKGIKNRQQLIERADCALYKSKENGRNQVTLYKECMLEDKKKSREKKPPCAQ